MSPDRGRPGNANPNGDRTPPAASRLFDEKNDDLVIAVASK
jgi:hypothetical protein